MILYIRNPEGISEPLFTGASTCLLVLLVVLFFCGQFFELCKKLYAWLTTTTSIKPPALFLILWNSNAFVALFCGIIGAVFFIHTFGTVVLDVTYTDWLMAGGFAGGDTPQHYTGWCMFRNSGWHFPPGLLDNIVYPFRESIISTDSIPLFAVIFKLFSSVLPDNFQYFGLFGLCVYFLQGALAGLIVKKLTSNTLAGILGSLFFVFSASMMQRIYAHTTLAAHFLILSCIYAWIVKENIRSCKKNIIIWGGLLSLSASIHMYFVPMVGIFMCFDLLDDFLQTKKIVPPLLTGFTSFACLLITMYIFGAFYSSADATAYGAGVFSSNINTLFNPLGGYSVSFNSLRFISTGVSKYLTILPLATVGQYEGFAYIGLGMILGLLMMLIWSLQNRDKIKETLTGQMTRKTKLIICTMFVFFMFALSPVVSINSHIIAKYYIPGIDTVFQIFRSSGRMIWPVAYILMFIIIWHIFKTYHTKIGMLVLVILLAVQYSDLQGFFLYKHNLYKEKSEWQTGLPNAAWNNLAQSYRHIFFFFHPEMPKVYFFLDLAIKNNLTTNDSYLARKNATQIEQNKQEEERRILMGQADAETIYVFETDESAAYSAYLDMYLIDGFFIGLKKQNK
jgi:hypothetical protein